MIKINMTFFVRNRVVKDTSGYFRNEQLNLPFSVSGTVVFFFFFISVVCM